MLQAILGKKIGMTQVYDDAGRLHPVTVVQAGPCSVLQVKTVRTDGYDAVQLGFGDVKPHRATKPQIARAAKTNVKPKKFIREIRLPAAPEDISPGQDITVECLRDVSRVDVIGTTKGKGFAGVMKRYGFKGQLATHGVERKHRSPGSIAGHASNQGKSGGLKKGKRMAGHMGHQRRTSKNNALIRIDPENNLLLIKGAVPGANGGYLVIRASVDLADKS